MSTIYALASGSVKCALCVVRISGSECEKVARALSIIKPNEGLSALKPRYAKLTKIIDAKTNNLIDKAIVLYFNAPNSFSGEDTLELQLHGSPAVIKQLFATLSKIENVQMAERGEFAKRAFLNNKMDLTQAEGLIDLINSQTKHQLKQAQNQADGKLGKLYKSYTVELTSILAHFEAYIDFPDEQLPRAQQLKLAKRLNSLYQNIKNHLADNNAGERMREGFCVAIIGKPNAGKSSLINALAKRDVAIVSNIAGTTRDVIEVLIDINGFPLRLFDTAGIRKSTDDIEIQGVKRSIETAKNAHIILLVVDGEKSEITPQYITNETKQFKNNPNIIVLANKSDSTNFQRIQSKLTKTTHPEIPTFPISALSEKGFSNFFDHLSNVLEKRFYQGNHPHHSPLITRARHREALEQCINSLNDATHELAQPSPPEELIAQNLRSALLSIGIITGTVDTESLLDIVFKDFCIGK